MESKLFVFYFLIFANFQVIYGQNEYLGCNYQIFNSQYTCMLTIYNPNGLNNFQRIGGTHMILRNDSDVISIWRQSGSNTKNIPSILCNTFRNAQIMYLHQIGIESIDDYSFANCSKLGYVNVNDNKVFHIAENAFQWNSYIGGLELKNNQIKSLGENTFVNLQSLKYLWISSNNITDLPSGIFSHLKSLESLTLGNNQISILKPEWFEILEIIEELDLSSNRIEQIPRNTFSSMKILRVITLDNNKLKVIRSDSFSMHPELRFLELQFNQIDAIDENIIYNTAAREIYMEGNLCANLTVYDNTTSREIFRYYLGRCFYNFNQLPVETTAATNPTQQPTTTISDTFTTPGGCIGGFLEERICRLENENEKLMDVVQEHEKEIMGLREENQKLQRALHDLERKVNELLNGAFVFH